MSLQTSKRLLRALHEAVEWTKTLSPEDAAKMQAAQQASFVRSITDYPRMRHEVINGVKVYFPEPPKTTPSTTPS